MNGYVCFYDNQRWETHADNLWAATEAAREHFNPPKSKRHMVHCYLAEKAGEPVTLDPASF